MNNEKELKQIVKEKYSQLATQSKKQNPGACCGVIDCCTDEGHSIMADDYSTLEGYNPDADLGLGCGLPTQFAQISEGNTVVDLGSGAGNDAFIARKLAGENGKIIGIDFSEAMIEKAKANTKKLGYTNVEFRLGDIESMPLESSVADVVLSNCVLNLVPNKQKVFEEVFRILKPGGHFSISDIVLEGALPDKLKKAAELYAGCVSGAIQKTAYLEIIAQKGFKKIILQKEKKITLPDEILQQFLTGQEIKEFKESQLGINSLSVYAEKPCCAPGSGCC